MNDSAVIQETESFFRRLTEPLKLFGREYDPLWWMALVVFVLTLGLFFAAWKYYQDSRSLYAPPARRILWWVLFGLPGLFLIAGALGFFGEMRDDARLHQAAGIVAVASILVLLYYYKIGIPLLCRWAVYFLLAYMFLLPSKQTWERSEKRSRVLVVLDVSDSMNTSDDAPGSPGGRTRLQKVIDYLADDKAAFLKELLDKNPVYVYRFGTRLDEEPQIIEKRVVGPAEAPENVDYLPVVRVATDPVTGVQKKEYGKPLAGADWEAFVKYNFKPWLLRGLSEPGQTLLTAQAEFEGKGDADWASKWLSLGDAAVPEGLAPADLEALKANRAKLPARIDVARAIASGTNVPDSLLALVNRESGNMVQGIIVFSDGRNTLGSESAITELRARAKREAIPIFTVAVGEDREVIRVAITDIQAPEQTPPDEPFKVAVEVDGDGLAGREVPITLDLFPPKRESSLKVQGTVKFAPGEPPHGQAEFVIDPAKLPEDLRSKASNFKDLIEGEWRVEATTPRVPGERFADKEHKGEPVVVKIEKKPLRVLLFASGPTRDYQFLLNQMIRDKADMSVFLQNEGGSTGKIAVVDDPERLLNHFPNRLRVDEDAAAKAEDKWYNLAKYDVIIAFDPDWSALTPDQLQMLQTWIELQAGGFIYVAGPFHTKYLARQDDMGAYRPLKEILPVVPGDSDISTARLTRDSKVPGRLKFYPQQDTDWLRLDDEQPDDPIAGWERFFTGLDKYQEDARIVRGFYNYYPIPLVKPGSSVVARFFAPQDVRAADGDGKDPPFLVTGKFGQGQTLFVASGEIWRIRQYREVYFERFWTKLTRYVSTGSRRKQDRRGRVLMPKEFAVGSYLRLQAQLLDAELKPVDAKLEPKLTIYPVALDQYQTKDIEKEHARYRKQFPLSAKAGRPEEWQGYFTRAVHLSPEQFPPGQWRLEVEIPSSSETLKQKFTIRPSNPETDNTRPDLAKLTEIAGDVEEVTSRVKSRAIVEQLRGVAPRTPDGQKLAFQFDNKPAVGLIPAFMDNPRKTVKNRGAVQDQWDQGPELPHWMTDWLDSDKKRTHHVGWLMLLAIGLLSAEWLTRKLLRLA